MKKTTMGAHVGALLYVVLCAPAGAGQWEDAERWQTDALLNPSPDRLERERSGGVTIYDGLTDKEVDSALDAQFHRVQSMMFVNVVITDDGGEPLRDAVTGEMLSGDDCD
jgi:hypothetical protein